MAKRKKTFNIDAAEETNFEETLNKSDGGKLPPEPPIETTTNSSPEEDDELKNIIGKMGGTDDVPTEDYNPLAGNVPPRGEHAKIKVDPSITKPIPDFVPPAADMFTSESETKEPVNPGLNAPEAGDKNQAAEAMVNFIIDIWRFLKEAAAKGVQIPTTKLVSLHVEQKIDMHYPVPLGDGKWTTFAYAIEQFNVQVQQPFTVSEDFITRVKQPMIREFARRGIGFTDMQQIMALWGFEIIKTAVSFGVATAIKNDLLNNEMMAHDKRKKGVNPNGPAQQAPPPTPNTTPPPEAPPIDNTPPPTPPAPDVAPPKTEYREPEEMKSEKLEAGGGS